MVDLSLRLSFGLYLAAFVLSVAGVLLSTSWRFRAGVFVLVLGWLSMAVSLGIRWHVSGRAPLSNQYESMLFLLWALIAIYFLFLSVSYPALEWLAPWVSGLALVAVGGISMLDSSIEPLVPALQSNWLLIHVSTTLLGYAALALAFLGGLVYLLYVPKRAEVAPTLDPFLYRSCALGLWLLTLGIITGAIWANSAWGSYWSWDPKETWALITWLYYAIAIHLRRTRGWIGPRFAWLLVVGFIFVMFTYFGVNYFLTGMHSYA
jgi:ABC-type transport system involved in cytochrome c biogenesis permease subunit